MRKFFLLVIGFAIPAALFGESDKLDTISIKPIGLDYSKYAGTDKLFMVGECEGMEGNQIVIFQNRPSFEFFVDDEVYKAEQKELERAIWNEILDNDEEPIILTGRWHDYNGRRVFLSQQILKINEGAPN